MIRWALLTILATGLFWVLYRLLLGRDRWLQLSRASIILTLAFGLAYPLVRLPEKVVPATNRVVVLEEIVVAPSGEASPTPTFQSTPTQEWTWVVPALYAGGVAITLAMLLVSVVQVLVRLRRMPYERRKGLKLSLLDDDTEPFSFFNHILVGTRAMSEEDLQLVLAHEGEHVRQGHSLDVLVARLMCCVAWFNPFAWLMLRELRAVHEYQADAAAQKDMNKAYLCLLYRQTTGFGYGHITNNFHSINLKKRITMMKRKKTRYGAWKLLAVLPVAALLMMVGCKSNDDKDTSASKDNNPTATTTGIKANDGKTVVDPELFDMENAPEGFQAPEYPGGMEALYKYLTENLRYP